MQAISYGSLKYTLVYVQNHRGDTIALVSNSTVVARLEYSAWGAINYQLSTTNSPAPFFTFSGKHYDEGAALYYYGYRWYDPQAKRWTQPDPEGLVEGLDLYQFCKNNPVNSLDVYGGWNVWNPSTYLDPNGAGWTVWDSLNPCHESAGYCDMTRQEASLLLQKGAASTLDGLIPFWDPFEVAYADDCGNVADQYRWSRDIAGFSRDLYLFARIPNLEKFFKNPINYSRGCQTIPNTVFDLYHLEKLGVAERGAWIAENSKMISWFAHGLGAGGWWWAAYYRTVLQAGGTGLAPAGRIFYIGLGSYSDYLYRHRQQQQNADSSR